MFNFFREGPRKPSKDLMDVLQSKGMVEAGKADSLRVVDRRADFSGRSIRQVRVFEADRFKARGIRVNMWTDLNAHLGELVASGHIDDDGAVVLYPTEKAAIVDAPVGSTRVAADRAAHGDDENLVFPKDGRF
jgi:hypothetical protein